MQRPGRRDGANAMSQCVWRRHVASDGVRCGWGACAWVGERTVAAASRHPGRASRRHPALRLGSAAPQLASPPTSPPALSTSCSGPLQQLPRQHRQHRHRRWRTPRRYCFDSAWRWQPRRPQSPDHAHAPLAPAPPLLRLQTQEPSQHLRAHRAPGPSRRRSRPTRSRRADHRELDRAGTPSSRAHPRGRRCRAQLLSEHGRARCVRAAVEGTGRLMREPGRALTRRISLRVLVSCRRAHASRMNTGTRTM